jgi:hypothetical protein
LGGGVGEQKEQKTFILSIEGIVKKMSYLQVYKITLFPMYHFFYLSYKHVHHFRIDLIESYEASVLYIRKRAGSLRGYNVHVVVS